MDIRQWTLFSIDKMKFSKVRQKIENLPRLIQKSAFIDSLLSEITIMNRSIWSDDSIEIEEKLDGLKWSNELVHRIQGIRFELNKQEDNRAIQRVFENILSYCAESAPLKANLAPCLKSTVERFESTEISWDFELNIDPKDRVIQILDKIPFKINNLNARLPRDKYAKLDERKFRALEQEYESLKSDWVNGYLMSVGISYSYSDIQLPKVYDIVFDIENTERFWKTKTIIKYAFNFRTFFHTDLWRGHHSHCLIEVVGDEPEIFNELSENDGGRTTYNRLGLCSEYDWQFIRKMI